MHFKHPEILWALSLLIIPIIIHLLRLRRFKKIQFTNVKLLQEVHIATNKRKSIKRWLLLATRLLLITSIILGFSQPYFGSLSKNTKKELVVYIDNSLSMQANQNGQTLLERAKQAMVQSLPKNTTFTWFTANDSFENTTLLETQNQLLSTSYTANSISISEAILKGKGFFSDNSDTEKQLLLLSDFKEKDPSVLPLSKDIEISAIPFTTNDTTNRSIDSLELLINKDETTALKVYLKADDKTNSIPVALYNNNVLVAKNTAKIDENGAGSTTFYDLDKTIEKGEIRIQDQDKYYDNTMYFSTPKIHKKKVLVITDNTKNWYKNLFKSTEYILEIKTSKILSYRNLHKNNIVITDEVANIPQTLQNNLKTYISGNGTLVVIPAKSSEIGSYNSFFTLLKSPVQFNYLIEKEVEISNIEFSHPLYKNVFTKEVTNFEYPKASSYFNIQNTSSTILSMMDGAPFLTASNNVFLFTAPFSETTFTASPLIVPTFYQLSQLKSDKTVLYYGFDAPITISLPEETSSEALLTLAKNSTSIIPLQKWSRKAIQFHPENSGVEAGTYTVHYADSILGKLSFNYDRKESVTPSFKTDLKNSEVYQNIPSWIENQENESSVQMLWKWFVTFAMFFALIEVLLQKFIT